MLSKDLGSALSGGKQHDDPNLRVLILSLTLQVDSNLSDRPDFQKAPASVPEIGMEGVKRRLANTVMDIRDFNMTASDRQDTNPTCLF